jgi:hypothetical protein
MVWVYGTGGTKAENAATLAKVRADAYAWWYRGNGRARILRDVDFDPEAYAGRNVILYGNADTNRAFTVIDETCPIRVGRGLVRVGKKTYPGTFGTLFLYPGNGALVGVVGATTPLAMRRMFGTRYFLSGVAIPDWVVFDDSVLEVGLPGVADAGYFTRSWRLMPGVDR